MKTFSLHNSEKLKHKKTIDSLFQNGKAIFVYPFKIIYTTKELHESFSMKFLVAVPKRNFKKAVDRNLLRRRTKESIRLQKNDFIAFLKNENKSCEIIFIFQGNEKMQYNEINTSILKGLEKLKNQIEKAV